MFDTDKIENGIAADYRKLFSCLQGQPTTLLEVGVWTGGSLLLWDDYFRHPDTVIVGVDNHIPDRTFPPRIRAELCDQNDAAGLQRLAERYGPFDVVIDDGAHTRRETEITFEALWPHVAVGGWYVIEDWAVGYWAHRPRFAGMVQLVTELVERAPRLNVSELDLRLAKGKALAIFRKGSEGWSE